MTLTAELEPVSLAADAEVACSRGVVQHPVPSVLGENLSAESLELESLDGRVTLLYIL